jgi:hypothetical protein
MTDDLEELTVCVIRMIIALMKEAVSFCETPVIV